MNQKKQRGLAIFALAIALVATTVAYAALSTTLQVSGSVTKKGGSWNVHLDNVTNKQVGGSATFTTQPTISGTTLNFSAKLVKPNDWFSFDVDLVNSGTVDAKLMGYNGSFGNDSIATSSDSTTTDSDVTCSILYQGFLLDRTDSVGWEDSRVKLDLSASSSVSNPTTKTITIKCQYDNVSSISATDKTINFNLNFNYYQG